MESAFSLAEDWLKTYSPLVPVTKNDVVPSLFVSSPNNFGTTFIFFFYFWEKIGKKLGRKNITDLLLHLL
jgi:hypothetical protein